MTAATTQGRLLFNVIMISLATIQKPGSFTVQIITRYTSFLGN